jgi:hypothetical protein
MFTVSLPAVLSDHSRMELWIGRDMERFAARAGSFIAARIERNVLATVLASVISGRYAEATFAVIADDGGETVAVAIRTPPHPMLVAGEIADPAAFIAGWLANDPRPSGVSGEPALARSVADAWAAATGGDFRTRVREALHLLGALTPPLRTVPGALRRADFRQSAHLVGWGIAFATEAGLGNPAGTAAGIEHQLTEQRLHVWEVDGAPVAMVGHNVEITGTVRIGPVYTPEALRGRGYATAATAALSRRLLDSGVERCILYTDLANPISNHVYAKLGYVVVADWEELSFAPAGR